MFSLSLSLSLPRIVRDSKLPLNLRLLSLCFLSPTCFRTTIFTKGYKVTLYSDSLRATTLYPIYTNGPNLGYQRGKCEYDHYTLVFDSSFMSVISYLLERRDLTLLMSTRCSPPMNRSSTYRMMTIGLESFLHRESC